MGTRHTGDRAARDAWGHRRLTVVLPRTTEAGEVAPPVQIVTQLVHGATAGRRARHQLIERRIEDVGNGAADNVLVLLGSQQAKSDRVSGYDDAVRGPRHRTVEQQVDKLGAMMETQQRIALMAAQEQALF